MSSSSIPKLLLNTDIWLDGYPIFSLSYIDHQKRVAMTDITGYRPDPKTILKPYKKYKCEIIFEKELSNEGKDILVLRRVKIGDVTFAYIR